MKKLIFVVSILIVSMLLAGCGAMDYADDVVENPEDYITGNVVAEPTEEEKLESDWPIYRSDRFGFQLRYPVEGVLAYAEETHARIRLPFEDGTNLSEKYLEIGTSDAVTNFNGIYAQECTPRSLETEARVVGRIEFNIHSAVDGAAGSVYEWVTYSTMRDAVCVSFTFVLCSGNPDNYATPIPRFDRVAESEVFERIVSTFEWLKK